MMDHRTYNPTADGTSRRGRRARLARRSARSRGAVIVLALLGAFMLAGMIGYAFNTGRHAQLRQQTQHAVDATAISGAGYAARSFNTVAMNNVEISRLIAVVQMLDAVPLAVEYTLLDILATLERVGEQLGSSWCPVDPDLIDRLADEAQNSHSDLFDGMAADLARLIQDHLASTIDQEMEDTLIEIEEELQEQLWFLEEMDAFFNQGGYDVREMTFYESEFGRGELWKAMESLDAISTATMENLEGLTQVTAIETGQRNMGGVGGETLAAIAPFQSQILWQRYDFDDFRDPVVDGRLPSWVDDEVTNRGPYDTVFGWRSLQREAEYTEPGDDADGTTQTGAGSSWTGGGSGRNRNSTTTWTLTGYTTYGTWQYLADINEAMIDRPDVLDESQYVTRVNRMSGNKLNYLWPGSAREWDFLDPEWITDFEQAQDIIEAGTPRVAYTQFIRQRHFQDYTFLPYDNTLLRAIGASQPYIIGGTYTEDWDIIRPRGGWTSVPGIAERTCDYVWDDGAIYDDPGTMTQPILASSDTERASLVNALRGNSAYTIYSTGGVLGDDEPAELGVSVRFPIVEVEVLIARFVWAGINVGPEVEIRDPNNFDSREDLPAPIDFDHEAMDRPEDGAVGLPGGAFTFLGLAKQPNRAPLWDGLFNTSAFDGHAAIAQASVFNNHSWDLWTQMWHAQLEPVQAYDQWVDLIRSQLGSASGYEDLSSGELEELADYLESLEPLAPVMLNH